MSLESGPLRLPIERILRAEAVRRVERDESAQEFGEKNKGDRKDGKPRARAEMEEETPHDVVEVSQDYHPSNLPITSAASPPHASRPAPFVAPRASKSGKVPAARPRPEPPPDRHLDIKV